MLKGCIILFEWGILTSILLFLSQCASLRILFILLIYSFVYLLMFGFGGWPALWLLGSESTFRTGLTFLLWVGYVGFDTDAKSSLFLFGPTCFLSNCWVGIYWHSGLRSGGGLFLTSGFTLIDLSATLTSTWEICFELLYSYDCTGKPTCFIAEP